MPDHLFMKDVLDKLTSYNLFNYLLPGVLFTVLLSKFTHYNLIPENLIIGAFIFYFIGLVISRFGSIIIEPFLKWTTFVKFAEYKEFVAASKVDEKIEILSEANNMYRTFCAMFVLLILIKLYTNIVDLWPELEIWNLYTLVIALLIMFLYSYRKQTAYITKRIASHK